MKNKVLFVFVLLLLLATPITVLASAKNATYLEWSWKGFKTGYFQVNKNGVIHGWSYIRGNDADQRPLHFVYKPLDKFPNATACDEGAVKENPNWVAINLHNVMFPAYDAAFHSVFGTGADLYKPYLLCGYPIE